MTIAGVLLLLYNYFFNRSMFYVRGFIKPLVIMSITSIFLANSLEFWSLNYLVSFKASFLYNLAPFFAIFFSFHMLNERMRPQKWAGLLIGFAGFILILTRHEPFPEPRFFLFLSWPEITMIIATGCMAYGWTYMRSIMIQGYSPLMANGVTMFFGGLLCFILSYIAEPWNPIPVTKVWPFLGCLFGLIVISNLIGYNWSAQLLKRYTSPFLLFGGFLAPLFTSFYGWLFLHETLYWQFFVAIIFVFLGVYLFYRNELQ